VQLEGEWQERLLLPEKTMTDLTMLGTGEGHQGAAAVPAWGRSVFVKTADLCDQFAAELKVCAPILRHYGQIRQFSGPIATVRVFEDNILVKEALRTVPRGTVLVVDGGGSTRCALLGDMMATVAAERGLAGVIIHGAIRDSAEVGAMDIGVMAVATNPLKSGKAGKGERDVALEFGGVTWTPGQFVYADEDGIVLAPRALAE
jgi:regulator of ribonuclease activity A